jgi:hypothetical protein
MAEAGSSSLHSSRASMMMRVWNVGSFEWTNNEFLHLRTERLLSDIRAPSRPGATPFGKGDTDRRAGRRVLGRSSGDCSGPREVSRAEEAGPEFPSAKVVSANVWAMVDFPVPARPFSQKTRWSRSPVNQLQSPRGHPSSFPSGTPACSHNGNQRLRCDTSGQEGRGPLIPIHRSVREDERQEVRLTMSRQLLL